MVEDALNVSGKEVGEAGDGIQVAIFVPYEFFGCKDTFGHAVRVACCPEVGQKLPRRSM